MESLESEFAQRRMRLGPAAKRPMIFSFAFTDRKVIDARNAQAHQAVLVELPVLVAVTAKPAATVIVPFIRETNGYAILAKGPQLFDEAVVQLASPLPPQKCFYRLMTL